MSKFQVGDRVRVSSDVKWWNGLTGNVTLVHGPSQGQYCVTLDTTGADLSFYENELRPADIHPQVSNAVSHPPHYSQGMPEGVEVIDIIRAQGADYEHGNIIKYILRWKYKNGLEDLKKAQQYLTWLIEKVGAINE